MEETTPKRTHCMPRPDAGFIIRTPGFGKYFLCTALKIVRQLQHLGKSLILNNKSDRQLACRLIGIQKTCFAAAGQQ
jgi:hypothetical protein